MRLLFALLLLGQTGTVSTGMLVKLPMEVKVAEFPFSDSSTKAGGFDTRCVIVYPREGKLGWLIDRKENKAELFYVDYPRPSFCDERKKP